MTSVKIDDIELKLNQTCEYRSSYDNKISMGKITEFRDMKEGSIWMCISDLENPQKKDWISLSVWKEHYEQGLFSKKQKNNDTNTEPEDNEEYPF